MKALFLLPLLLSTLLPSAGETNFWIGTGPGNWGDASNWSLHSIPSPSQAAFITGPGAKSILIDDRVQDALGMLSVNQLVVTNANITLTHEAGPNRSLQIQESLEIYDGATFLNRNSAVNANRSIRIGSGRVLQDGGAIAAPSISIFGVGSYQLTDGDLKSSFLDLPSGGSFLQHGGTVALSDSLHLAWSTYQLDGGMLFAPTERVSESAGFTQTGGTNSCGSLLMAGYSSAAAYRLSGGLLIASNVYVMGALQPATFTQDGGVVVVTSLFRISGSARYYPPVGIYGKYVLSAPGLLEAPALEVDMAYGFARLESSGDLRVAGNLTFVGDPQYPGDLSLSGGQLSCSNLLSDGKAVLDIRQTDGAFIVSNRFSFHGKYPGVFDGIRARLGRFDFIGGTFSGAEIDLGAEWVIGSSTNSGRITNSNTFQLSGKLTSGDAREGFGKFILAGNASIDLGLGKARLRFARSAGEIWTNTAYLIVTNWAGSPNGGGEDQIIFGNDASALTTNQLKQIGFVNPGGLPSGQYDAAILPTGEIVPAEKWIKFSLRPSAVVLTWTINRPLQSAAHPAGPYLDVPSAASPFTNDFSTEPRRFFRLRSQAIQP